MNENKGTKKGIGPLLVRRVRRVLTKLSILISKQSTLDLLEKMIQAFA